MAAIGNLATLPRLIGALYAFVSDSRKGTRWCRL